MVKTLEQLLDGIRKNGWKPYGQEVKDIKAFHSTHFIVRWLVEFELEGYAAAHVSLKELLTDSNSGLWQFVCENGMEKMAEGFYWQNIFPLDSIEYEYVDYQYWIIESALKDESELEQFLLDNIKIEG